VTAVDSSLADRSCRCLFDYVDIFTIDDKQTKNHEDRFCGESLPSFRIALQQTVEILLKSFYGPNGHRGFLASYRFIDESRTSS